MLTARCGLLALVLGAAACGPGEMRSAEQGRDAGAPVSDAAMRPPDPPPPDAGTFEAAAETLRVVQCNPYYAGRLDPYDGAAPSCARTADCAPEGETCGGADSPDGCLECIDRRCRRRTWATAADMAARVRDIGADVIGMQEIPPMHADRVIAILEDATSAPWDARIVEQGVGGRGSGVGVFWREDRVALVRDLGATDLDTLDSGYVLRFAGVMLRPIGSDDPLAVFSGKLYWDRGAVARRGTEAARLRAWIGETLRGEEGTPRVIAVDLNDEVGSPAYAALAADYDDGGARKATAPGQSPDGPSGRRIDFLFWSRGKPTPEEGFVTERSDGRLGRSGYFGSDHRFVYGDARVRVSP